MDDQENDEMDEKPAEEFASQPPPPAVKGDLMDYDTALELTGKGKFSYRVLSASCVIFNYSIIEMAAIAYIITPAECDLNLSVAQKSLIGSAVYLGIIATSILWGELSDHLGRRKVMLPSLVLSIIASFFSSLCTSFWPLFIFRFLVGCAISAPSAVVFVYLGELQTSEFRDVAIAIAVTSAQAVFCLLPGVAWIIVPHSWSFNLLVLIRPWRVFMWTWGIVGWVGVFQLLHLPESPSFLMIKKGPSAALPVLAKMYAENNNTERDQYPVQGILEKHEHKSSIKADFVQLIKQPMLKCYLITHYCMFIVFFFANGLYMWMPDFVNEMLKDVGGHLSICKLVNKNYLKIEEYTDYEDYVDDLFPVYGEYLSPKNENLTNITSFYDSSANAYTAMPQSDDCAEGEVDKFLYPLTMIIEFITLIPFILVNIYIHKYDKLKLYGIIIIANSVAIFLSAIIPQLSVATVFFVLGLCTGGACSILSALAVDAFPISLRSLAMCTMYTAGHLGAIVGNLIITIMIHIWCYVIFTLITVISIGSAVVLYLFWPDLKEVRTEMEAREFTY